MPQNISEAGSDAVQRLNRYSLRLFGLVARVRPEERRDVAGALLTLFGFMTGHALLETARDALFLAALPARQLPWVYLIIAVLALLIGQGESRVTRAMPGRSELGRWLVAASGVTLVLWVLAGNDWPWVFYTLYVWSGTLASLVVVRFWTLLGSRFTLTQAKRIFPLIASGSVAGGIAGAATARMLTEVIVPRHLVLVAGLVFLAASMAPRVLAAEHPSQHSPPRPDGLGRVARMIWAGPYLRRVAALVLLATVTFTLVDFVFKSSADRLVAPEQLGEFFSSVYLTVNVLSLLVQLFVVGWLLRRMGLVSVVSVVPAVMLVSTVGFAVAGGLTFALVLKGADGTLRHSLYRTGTELLFVPLSERLRTQVKGVIDVLGQRGGQALASIVILMVLSTTGREGVFAGLACLTAAAWLLVAVGLREPYLDLFRETLYGGGAADEGGRNLDLASLETLLATLNAPDDRRVIAALDVLREQDKVGVVPGLLLYHPSPRVVAEALDTFATAGRDDVLPMVPRLLGHAEARVRAAAVRALAALGPDRAQLGRAASDPDPGVAATADVVLVAAGWADRNDALEELTARWGEHDSDTKRALASALCLRPHPALEPLVVRLLADEDAAVVPEAIRAARVLRTPGLVQPLLHLLGKRTVREEARMALAAYGSPGIAPLSDALRNPELPSSIRRHVPGALALIGSAQVPEILLRHLQSEADGMIRFKVLRALGRWRREQPHLPLDVRLLQAALGQALSTGFRLMGWRQRVEVAGQWAPALATEAHEVLLALLRDKQDHALERVFRLLNLQAGSEEFHRIYRGVHSTNPTTRAGSRELLHHMILPPVRRALMTLVDDLHGESRDDPGGRTDTRTRHTEYEKVLSELIGCGMESVSSLAAFHAAELGMTAVRDAVEAAKPRSEEHAKALRRVADALAEEVS